MKNDIFKNIKIKNILSLINLLKTDPQNMSFVEENYLYFNNYFTETLNFLIELGLIQKKEHKIFVKRIGELKEQILKSLIMKNKISLTVSEYLSYFKKDSDKQISYFPSYQQNLKTSYIRNFLMDLGIIENKANKIIFKGPEKILKKLNHQISPYELKKILKKKEEIGLKAEHVIINYEKAKLKELKIDLNIEHIAQKDVSAGYDIISYRKSGNKIIKIFIEVKAVSIFNYEFYLSELEYSTALKKKENYFLYLLPVDYSRENNFNLNKLKKVNNIEKQIFLNETNWNIFNSNYRINKKS